MDNSQNISLEIRKLRGMEEAAECARLMSTSEPWITLRRDYDLCFKMLTDSRREVYTALLRQELVGFMILQMRGPFVGFIQTVGVKQEWRNKGIGSRLLKYAEDRILKVTPNVFMCVSSFNPKAQKLYSRMGYQVIGELKDFIVPGHSEILLRKFIAPLTEFKPNYDTREEQSLTNVVIRPAGTGDIEALCNLYIEFHEFHVSGIPDRLVSVEKIDSSQTQELRRNLEKIIKDGNSVIFAACIDDRIVGLAEVYLRKDEPHPAKKSYTYGHLQSLVVTEKSRLKGVAKRLVEFAEKWSKERGASEMRLDIWEFTEGPLQFYERLGYRTLRRNLVRVFD
jgi:ribosomal-protein-alanine N-acetyltransferase